MANNRVSLSVEFYGYDRFKDGAPTEMRIEFQRLCSREKISKLAADLIALAVDFTFDPRTGDERGPAIRMGWYSPKAAEIVEVLTSHGFVVKQEIKVKEHGEDITAAALAGTYVEPPKEEARDARAAF